VSDADAPGTGSIPSHHLAAVWFADLVGYSALSETNEGEALRAVGRFQAIVRAIVQTHGGRVVKFLGDGALAEFPSTEQAVRSADTLRADLARVAEAEGLGVRELRIGVHVGDVAETGDGDLYGDGVNVASRIQAAADPGEVWVSEDVWRQLRQRPELRFAPRGEHALKGLRTPLALHAVGIGESAPTQVPSAAEPERVEVPAAPSAGRKSTGGWNRRRALSLLGAGILIAIVAIGASTWFLGRGSDAGEAGAVLAVLPFENLSGDEATEPFVLGVHDDLLTHLSRIGTLKVISRTSVMGYEGSTKSIPEIAQELGATTVLEGGIQRSGDRIRMNVQLIDARTDEHLWAEQFDRTLTAEDVFAIQAEIAGRIAEALATALTPQEEAELASAPTKDLEALDRYYEGLVYYRDRSLGENSRRAESSLAAAVAADPQFAAAWAALAQTRAWRLRLGATTDAAAVREALDRAIALAPEARETALAEGIYLYYAKADFAGAADRFETILSRSPGDVEALGGYSLVLRRLGRWREAIEVAERALEVDPRNPEMMWHLGENLTYVRRYDEAEEPLDRAIALNPEFLGPQFGKYGLTILRGDLEGARRLTADLAGRLPPEARSILIAQQAVLDRDYAAGIEALEGQPIDRDSPADALTTLAALHRWAGNEAEARVYSDSLLAVSERKIAELASDSLDPFVQRAVYVAARGVAHALSGRPTEARRDGRLALDLLPVSRDAVEAENVLMPVSKLYALIGDRDAAFRVLDTLASIPSLLSAAIVRLDPSYDSLRDDPRYAALLAKLEAAERSGTGTL
jgi:TolB-like protein/class 3 adenylate cyclase/Flp pilus assembly protein TadD